ncbi:zinc-dependent metalloprotease [Nocardia puris]|uniref:Putative hydrolase n=1 Tax=Nocardia puris TaxID=208602 RepID=A0A366DQM2_9NOCA|nr:zinc-dependent metalloprotease [Nocardia puris]MBF6364705.1 zinc-dependent metalloprotease [Nocardia puris]MBF6463133.1 zinc-dependent metalloprotease [Nocardia puris]RBO92380.1 putative hydrolase [Nocardia puris]
MTDFPFGFSNRDDDDARKRREEPIGPGANDPFGFGAAGGFDPSQLGQMLTSLGQMLSGMGQSGSGQSGPVNYDVAKRLARQQLGAAIAPVSASTGQAIADAAHLAELWLDGATTLPAGATKTVAWTPNDWIEETLTTWKRLCDPVAEQIAGMWTSQLPPEARELAGPMMGMLGQMGGLAFGSQLGQALGQLAKEVLTSTDIGLPLGPSGTAALLPAAISEFSAGLEQPESEIMVFLAAREAAHQRLFGHVPWLRQQVLGAVEDYARGIRMDFSALEQAAQGIDPMSLTDPSKLEEILSQGAFEPQTTPEQKQALERLETLLALIEGWVQVVVAEAVGDRLPGAGALAETLRRRRATGGPAEQTFATLVGLELRPRKLREAADLWRRLTTDAGMEARDGVWAHPDLLPDSEDLDSPAGFIDSVIGGGTTAFDDPLAQLAETEARERAESEKGDRDQGPDLGKDSDAS